MSTAPVFPPSSAETLRRKRFTRQEVEIMLDSGIFDGQRWELIDGELIDKMGQNPPHASTVRLVLKWLAGIFGLNLVQAQLPIETRGEDADRSVPEPDVAVFLEDKPDYEKRHPRGDELRLAVEVADTSAAFDLSRKAALYASAGVPEYWVVDLQKRMLVIHRQPVNGQYRQVRFHSEEELVTLEGRSEAVLIRSLLPKV